MCRTCIVCHIRGPKKVVCVDCYTQQMELVKLIARRLRDSQGQVLTARIANDFLREILEVKGLLPPLAA